MPISSRPFSFAAAAFGLALTGCGAAGVTIVPGEAVGPANTPPAIRGVPATSVNPGASYTFQPTASDTDGDTLAFSVQNKPSWASFSPVTGLLSGIAQPGTYADIVISVSDGKVTSELSAFTLLVSVPAGTGTAHLSWLAPTQNTDGSVLPIADLAGYRVYHGLSPSRLDNVTAVMGGGATLSYLVEGLPSGTNYFAVTAVNVGGIESAFSAIGSKIIP